MRKDVHINNKGLSLVELLIAVTILAIIVVPLLHAFVSSARINSKSKATQRITTIGQDIMEGLKAYSIEDLAYEFDYPTPGSCSSHPSGFQLISPTMLDSSNSRIMELAKSGPGYSQVNATSTPAQSIIEKWTPPAVSYEFNTSKYSAHDPYYFAVTNISSQRSTAGSYKADILITVDPRKYINDADATALGVSGRNVSNNSAQHNSNPIADLYSMDTTRDAFFLESGSQVNDAYNQLRTMGAAITSARDINKEITVTVDNEGANKKVVYTFKYKAGGHEVIYPTNPTLNTMRYSSLENVYLFYMPSYNTSGDNITYTNNTGDEKVFTLVKRQILPEDGLVPAYSMGDFISLDAAEKDYHCSVTINDSSGKTTFKTNVDTNLASLIKDPANTYGSEEILKPSTDMHNVHISYPAGTRLSVAGTKNEDRIFDVTIDIYEAGTIDAAISSGAELPADKKITTLHGNMN